MFILLTALISGSELTIFNLIILIFTLGYLYFQNFIVPYPFSCKNLRAMKLFYQILRLYIFSAILIILVLKIPEISSSIQRASPFVLQQFSSIQLGDKIFILFIIQILFDIVSNSDYESLIDSKFRSKSLKSRMIFLCYSYQQNNTKIEQIGNDLQQKGKLDQSV